MRTELDNFDLADAGQEDADSGFLGLALLALALGAGTALLFAPAEGARTRRAVRGQLQEWRGGAEAAFERVQREFGRRQARRRRERQSSALLGLAVGAGLAALFTPESGPNIRRRLSERLRRRAEEAAGTERVVREPQPDPVPTT